MNPSGNDAAWRNPGLATLVYPASPAPSDPVDATIIVTSVERSDELMTAVRSAAAQRGCSNEVILVDAGSTDRVADRVHEAFPSVNIYRSEDRLPMLVTRNFMTAHARGRIVVSIDDDAELVDSLTVARTLADFDDAVEVGAVAIPYRELTSAGTWFTAQSSTRPGIEFIDSFVGTAYAVRRDLFLDLGGFWEYRANEERDYCLRLLQAGYGVRIGTAPALEHRPSPMRSLAQMSFNGRRSDVQFIYRNVPSANVPWALIRTTGNLAVAAAMIGRGRYAKDMYRGYIQGFREIPRSLRSPVDPEIYRLSLRLRRAGPLPLEQLRAILARRKRR